MLKHLLEASHFLREAAPSARAQALTDLIDYARIAVPVHRGHFVE